MSKVVVQAIGMSLDGFSAGTDQSLDEPLGVLGRDLMDWFFPTKTFIEQHGGEGGETGIDDGFAAQSMSVKERGYLGEICSARFAGLGPMTTGKAGGAKIRRIMCRPLF